MKNISDAALQAMADGTAITVGALRIDTPVPIRVWDGFGPINLPGEAAPFEPLGGKSLITVNGGAIGSAAQAITLSLSGIEPDALTVDDSDTVEGSAVTLWRLIFAGDGKTLLDAGVWARGRIDTVEREDEVGGTAVISAKLETAARGLGRSGARLRSDADQRLVKVNDGFFRGVSFAGEKTLYWGGPRPASAGAALGGGGLGTSGGNREGGNRFARLS